LSSDLSPVIVAAIIQNATLVKIKQESRAIARKSRDAAAVVFGLKFADNNHYKFKSNQASNIYRHKTEFNAK